MAEKKKNIKPLIILGVVLVAALIGFLIYDEVKTANYKKELNLAIQNTYDLESGSCVGQTYNYQKENPEEKSEAVRQANFVRTDDGLIFHESTGNEDGSALVSDVFVKPGEYFYLGEDAKWVRTEIDKSLTTRPYSMATISRSIEDVQFKRIHPVEVPQGVEADKAYQVVLTRQWIKASYQGEGEPLTSSITYLIRYEGDTPYITQVSQTFDLRTTDEDGKEQIEVVEERAEFTKGTTADGGDVQQALDSFFKENIEGNYVEAETEETEESTEQTEGELTVGESAEK